MPSMNLITGAQTEHLQLGSVVIAAEQVRLKTACPVLRKRLADGSELLSVLPEQACTLTVSGRAIREDHAAGTLLSAFHTLMHTRMMYTFSLEGCSFVNMRLTACELHADCQAQTADCTLVLTGQMEAEI